MGFIRIIFLICPFIIWGQLQRINPVYLHPGFMEYPALFSEPSRFLVTTGNRSLLGPFNNIRSYYVAAQYSPDTLKQNIGLIVHTEKEGELLRWSRAHAQYSYAIKFNEETYWKFGAGLGFYNMVIEGTNSTGSLSAWALRSSIASAFKYKRHQFSTVFQDIGNPKLYQEMRYSSYLQSMLQVNAFANPLRELNFYYFNRFFQQQMQHDLAWKLSLARRLHFGHAVRFSRGNSFYIDGDVLDNTFYKFNLQFVYNTPLFSKISSDFQSVEIRLHFSKK